MIRTPILLVLALIVAATFALGDEARDINLRIFHCSHRVGFENYVRFSDNSTVMIGFEAVNTTSAPPSTNRTGKPLPGNFVYTVVRLDFGSGKLKNQHSFPTTGIPILLPLSNGNFILADAKSVVLYSSEFQQIATQAVSESSKYDQVSLSSDERLVFLRENSRNDSIIQSFKTVDLQPVARTVIADLLIGGFGRVVIAPDVLLISRPGTQLKERRLYYRAWDSNESEFTACASGLPLLATTSHKLIVNCPPLMLTDFDGHVIATNSELNSRKETIANWRNDAITESRDGRRLAFATIRLGGGIEALDIGPHVTHERVVILDALSLSVVRSIPVHKHRSVLTTVALSPDGSRLAYIHGFILTLVPN